MGGRLAPGEDRLLADCGRWCCFVCDFMAFNAERWKTARGDDGYLSIEYGLWRRKCFRQGRAVFCGGFEALGFGLVQVVGLRLDQGGRSCRRWMAKLGRWLCSPVILQNNFEIFGIFARFLSARGYGWAVLRASVGSVAWLCEESGPLGCVFWCVG